MPGRTVLEFSQRLTPKTCRPRGRDYAIPHPFRGLIAALAEHQTLLGDAVATEDPRILADALYCYPVQQGSRNAREAAKALLAVHAEAIPAAFRQTADYLTAPPS
jgi:alpha-galactosidase/6-phospho-beta-glucosidase family protein